MKREDALRKSIDVVIHLKRNNIRALFYNDIDYPRRLKQCIDAPSIIYMKGNVSLNESKVVAIVGTRNATHYGKQICRELISSFKNLNIIVVSGLALGIDVTAHRSCLEFGIPTIGVLGHGFDRVYPAKHGSVAKHMLNNGGLITEFVPGTKPDRENFPKRNRIVAGMCDATIVIESKLKGGSLITAHLANDYNRDVFAFPGSIHHETSQGCNKLIADQKAHLIQCPDDFFKLMNWKEDQKNIDVQGILFPSLSAKQKLILDIIAQEREAQIDVIALKAKTPISELNPELFHLEMEGVIQCLPGKQYRLA
jgi:DNA processing protein